MMKNDSELHRLELAISYFLRVGVALSALLLAVGWIGQLIDTGDVLSNFQHYNPEPLTSMLTKGWESQNYPILISISGLAVLIALPPLRVLLTAYLFIKQRDFYLAAMALFVFAVLLGSFALGITVH